MRTSNCIRIIIDSRHSYGCHDNYLVSRSLPFAQLVSGLLPFLVSRQLVAGAGKVGMEAQESGFVPGPFQISQRADFMEAELEVDTMHNRPILNTRDEPHADRTILTSAPDPRRREHVRIRDGAQGRHHQAGAGHAPTWRGPKPGIEQPVAAIKQLSRDPDLKTTVRLKDGRTISGLAIQEEYWNAASRCCAGSDPDADWVLREWQETSLCASSGSHAISREARLGDQAVAA